MLIPRPIIAPVVLLLLLSVFSCASGKRQVERTADPLPMQTTTSTSIDQVPSNGSTVSFGDSEWVPFHRLDLLLKSYPTVVVARVNRVLLPFDPRAGFLGTSPEELKALQTGPKGTQIPEDELARAPGSLMSIYAAQVIRTVAGSSLPEGSEFALTQSGGTFEGTSFEDAGDPVIQLGATYLFFLKPFDWKTNGFPLPTDWANLGDQFQSIFQGTPFGRLVVSENRLSSIGGIADCFNCQIAALFSGESVDDAEGQIRDVLEGRSIPSPVATRAPTVISPGTVSLVGINAGDPMPRDSAVLPELQTCGTIGSAAVSSGVTTDSSGDNWLIDANSRTNPSWTNMAVTIDSGPAVGQSRRITSAIDGKLMIDPNWSMIPPVGSAYSIIPTKTIDVAVSNVPQFDGATGSGGLAGFTFSVDFDPSVVTILGVNAAGEADSLLSAAGERIPYDVIDADGELGAPFAPLPATKGHLRVDMLDISQNYESGSGVLARLLVVASGPGSSGIKLRDVAIYDAAGGTYKVETIGDGDLLIGSRCP